MPARGGGNGPAAGSGVVLALCVLQLVAEALATRPCVGVPDRPPAAGRPQLHAPEAGTGRRMLRGPAAAPAAATAEAAEVPVPRRSRHPVIRASREALRRQPALPLRGGPRSLQQSASSEEVPDECQELGLRLSSAPSANKERSGGRSGLGGAVTLVNQGAGFVALEAVVVRIASAGGEFEGVFASCPGDVDEVAIGPQDELTCTWEAELPKGQTPDMFTGVYSEVTLTMTGESCETACINPLLGGAGAC